MSPVENKDTPPQEEKRVKHEMPITGRFDQYRSSYWAAMLAAFGIRYPVRTVLRGMEDHHHFGKKHAYSAIAGGLMEGVTAFFAIRTWQDMRKIFEQPVAWELNKEPQDVSLFDFWKSKNTMVQQTVSNYVRYNMRRALVNSFFFLPFLAKPLFKGAAAKSRWNPNNWHWETGADLGLGANAAYLFSDVMSRKMTPFESLQAAIDHKINHAEHAGDQMTAVDLLDIYERHADKGSIISFKEQRGTPRWEKSMVVFDRMADLMNETYGNVPTQEKADFGIPKFIYLVGNNLIDPNNAEKTLAYIEVANRYGVPALRDVVAQTKAGVDLQTALKPYPIPSPEDITVAKSGDLQDKFATSVAPASAQGWAKPAVSGDKNFVDRLKDTPAPHMNMSA